MAPPAARGSLLVAVPLLCAVVRVAAFEQRPHGLRLVAARTAPRAAPPSRRLVMSSTETTTRVASFNLMDDPRMADMWELNRPRTPVKRGPTPREEEETLTVTIEGAPTVAVVGRVFDDASRSDQFVLDCLHAQGAWGKIVAYCEDPVGTKKRLTSRSARYSGLLDVLELQPVQTGAPLASTVMGPVAEVEVDAVLAFDVPPNEVATFLKAAEANDRVRRIVVTTRLVDASPAVPDEDQATEAEEDEGSGVSSPPKQKTPPPPPPPASTWLAEALALPELDESKLDAWSVVAFDASDDAPHKDDAPEGAPIAVDKTFNSTELAAPRAVVARADAHRLAAEAFVLAPAMNRPFAVTAGDAEAAAHVRMLRERGYSRRGELAKLVNGSYELYQVELAEQAVAAEAAAAKRLADLTTPSTYVDGTVTADKKATAQEINEKAREILAAEWNEIKYGAAKGVRKELYIQHEWKRGIRMAHKALGLPPPPEEKKKRVARPMDEELKKLRDQRR